jgi:hypothetical protein
VLPSRRGLTFGAEWIVRFAAELLVVIFNRSSQIGHQMLGKRKHRIGRKLVGAERHAALKTLLCLLKLSRLAKTVSKIEERRFPVRITTHVNSFFDGVDSNCRREGTPEKTKC